MRIAASIAKIDNHESLSQSLTHEGRYRAARAAKKCIPVENLHKIVIDYKILDVYAKQQYGVIAR